MYSYRYSLRENKDSETGNTTNAHHGCKVCSGTGRDLSIDYIDACPICTRLAEDHYQRLRQ